MLFVCLAVYVRWIGCILFCTVLILAGYIMAGMLEPASTRFIVESYFVTASVINVIAGLMVPKFLPIWHGTIYNPDSLQYDSVSFSSSLLSKDDLRRMRKYLRSAFIFSLFFFLCVICLFGGTFRKFGYKVYKKGESSMAMYDIDEARTRQESMFNLLRRSTSMREGVEALFSRLHSKFSSSKTMEDMDSTTLAEVKHDDVSVTVLSGSDPSKSLS